MNRLLRRLLPPTLLFLLCGCGIISKAIHSHRHPKDDDDKGSKDLLIGVIDLVNPEQHFVLIRTGMQLKLSPGWKLETRPVSGPKSVLVITPEQKLNFLSADIVEGYPQQGDPVVLPPQTGLSAAPGPGNPTPPNPAPGVPAPIPANPAPTQAAALPATPPPFLPVNPPPPAQPPAAPIHAPTGEELPPPIR